MAAENLTSGALSPVKISFIHIWHPDHEETMPPLAPFPEYVTFYPGLGIQAARRGSGVGGGWRLYTLAKALDLSGLGKIPINLLRAWYQELGVPHVQWKRWIDEARNYGLVGDYQTRDGIWMLTLLSAPKAAQAMGCQSVGNHKVSMKAADLLGIGWRARVWAAVISGQRGRPVSRKTLLRMTGVPERTQSYREKQASVLRTANYCKSDLPADNLPMLREMSGRQAIFATGDGKIAWRLPDIRTTEIATLVGPGRARKVNKALRCLYQQSGSSLMRRAFSETDVSFEPGAFVRLFHSTPKQLRATERRLSESDNSIVNELYEYSHMSRRGSRIWKSCSTSGGKREP